VSGPRVAVLAGGRSSEHDVSLLSAKAVVEGLQQAGLDAWPVQIDRTGIWRSGDEELLLAPGAGFPGADVVFPALHGPFGEDGVVQGMLETLDVPFVGSGVEASALCMDKVLSKALMGSVGFDQVDYAAVDARGWTRRRAELEAQCLELGLPVFVKPSRLGSSVGIRKVSREGELAPAIDDALEHDELVIVEAASGGLEIECGVLELAGGELSASPPGRIEFDREFYDYEAKYSPGGMRLTVPADLPAAVAGRVRELALKAFETAGCEGLARIDFFVEGESVLLNEINTMPGFTPFSVYAKLVGAGGVGYPELVRGLCERALERHARRRAIVY